MPKLINFPSEWIAFIVFFLFITSFIGLAEILRNKLEWSPELTRKLVHVLVGILVSFAPFILESGIWAIVLAVIFTVINALALKSSALEGMHATERISYGTVYFPIAFGLLVWIYWDSNPAIFLTGMMILTFADTAATIVGERVPDEKKYRLWADLKSIQGSSAFFITAFVIVLFAYPYFLMLSGGTPPTLTALLLIAILTSFFAMLTEAVSRQGSDNLTLTLAAAFSLDLITSAIQAGVLSSFLLWMLGSGFAFYLAYRLRSLTISGGIGAFILGCFLFGIDAWSAVSPLIVFFVLSSILSKLADRSKRDTQMAAKGSNRDIVQVYANAGIGLILVLAWYLTGFQHELLFLTFLSSIAAATADTWETEFGAFSPWEPRHILSWQSVPKGYSGGITVIGTLGGVAGAAIIGYTGMLLAPEYVGWLELALVTIAGLLGSIVDSILGATLQGKFRCRVCGKHTEKHIHCDQETEHIGGIYRLDNDWVNMSCTASAPVILLVLWLFI